MPLALCAKKDGIYKGAGPFVHKSDLGTKGEGGGQVLVGKLRMPVRPVAFRNGLLEWSKNLYQHSKSKYVLNFVNSYFAAFLCL